MGAKGWRWPAMACVLALVVGCGEAAPEAPATSTTEPLPTTTTIAASSTTVPATSSSLEEELSGAAELEEKLGWAAGSECATSNVTASLIDFFPDADLELDSIGVYLLGDSEVDWYVQYGVMAVPEADFERIESGGTSMVWTNYSLAEGDAARLHGGLFANHGRVFEAFTIFLQYPGPWTVEIEPGWPDPNADWWGDEPMVWDGDVLTIPGQDPWELPALGLLRNPIEPLVVGQEARELAWLGVEQWFDEAATLIWDGQVTDLEDADLTEIVPTLCLLLATEWKLADDVMQETRMYELQEEPWVVFRELTIQELLLATEYIEMIEARMSEPGIEWLRGDGVDLSGDQGDGITSDREYVVFWQSAAQHALLRATEYLRNADPLDG